MMKVTGLLAAFSDLTVAETGTETETGQQSSSLSLPLLAFNGPAAAYDPHFIREHLTAAESCDDKDDDAGHGDVGIGSSISPFPCLPNTVSLALRGVSSTDVMPLLAASLACSTGSACHAAPLPGAGADASHGGGGSGVVMVHKASDVLLAMKVPLQLALGTLRFIITDLACCVLV